MIINLEIDTDQLDVDMEIEEVDAYITQNREAVVNAMADAALAALQKEMN